ncbi:eCIS core domain-containing protein [Aureivirga marina]|uniref:eCIS core domain-containing protein n=1 Tax=Aureivirga marina TaxID=1182451 RepID=UPI0018C95331|nr:DUF4157 domain-containing protein [Aureivirga marina]
MGMKINKSSDKKKENSINKVSQLKKKENPNYQFKDNRNETTKQLKLQKLANNNSSTFKNIQFQKTSSNHNIIQQKNNHTGLPDKLKNGIENLSGYSMDDVKVHYNSNKPAQLKAHAYAQGTNIHLASGQEKHLAHEAWHVVQQKQGRVQTTTQLKENININDDQSLEKEADIMGAKALETSNYSTKSLTKSHNSGIINQRIVQGQWWKTPLRYAMELRQKYTSQSSFLPKKEHFTNQKPIRLGPIELNFLARNFGGQEVKTEFTFLKANYLRSKKGIPFFDYILNWAVPYYGLSKSDEAYIKSKFSIDFLGAEKSAHPVESENIFKQLDLKFYLFKLIKERKIQRVKESMFGKEMGTDLLETTNKIEYEFDTNFTFKDILEGNLNLFPVFAGEHKRTNSRLGSEFGYSYKASGNIKELMSKNPKELFFFNLKYQKFNSATKFELNQIPVIFDTLMQEGKELRHTNSINFGVNSSQEMDVLEVMQILHAHDVALAEKLLPKLILASRNNKFPDQKQDKELPMEMIREHKDGYHENTVELYKLLFKHGISLPQLITIISFLILSSQLYKKTTGNKETSTTETKSE